MENNLDINHFKQLLEDNKSRLEQELGEMGKRNPDVEGDWEVSAPDIDVLASDRNEVADKVEEIEERSLLLDNFEEEYNLTVAALKRIAEGQYGLCEQCNKPIKKERLEAYPAAQTCIEHAPKQNS